MFVPGLLDGARVKSAHVVMSSDALHRSPPAAEYGATKCGKASRAARRHDERAPAPRTSRGFPEPAFVDACNSLLPVQNGPLGNGGDTPGWGAHTPGDPPFRP